MNVSGVPTTTQVIDNSSSQIKEGFSFYHSPELGFEIAYPSDWVVEEPEMASDLKYGIYFTVPTPIE